MMKSFLAAALAVLAMLAPADSARAQTPKHTVKFAWQLPIGNYGSKGAEDVAACIASRSNGTFKIDTYPAGQLYRARELYEAVRTGTIELALITLGSLATTDPIADILYLPFVFKDQQQMFTALHGKLGERLQQGAGRAGVTILAYFAGSGGQFGTKAKALRLPRDFAGQKIRVPSATAADVVQKLGGVPATIAATEVYLALQRGTVDGTNFPLTSFYDRKLFEVLKHLTLATVSLDPDGLVANQRFWNRLDAQEKKIITDCSNEAEKSVRDAEAALRKEYVEKLKAAGMEVIELNAAEFKAWADATRPTVEEFARKHGEAAQQLIAYISGLPTP